MSVLPVMVSPIVDPVVTRPDAPCSYTAPPLPVLQSNDQDPIMRMSPFREVADSPILDVFPSYLKSPPGSEYEPVTSPITPSLREDDAFRPPSSHTTMDQYLTRSGDLLLGESTDLPLLVTPLTPRSFIEEMVLGSSVGAPTGEPVAAPWHGMPDLSREGPFNVHQDASDRTLSADIVQSTGPRTVLSRPSTGCLQKSCAWHSNTNRSQPKLYSSWRRLTEYDGRRTTWRPWGCGVRHVLRQIPGPIPSSSCNVCMTLFP